MCYLLLRKWASQQNFNSDLILQQTIQLTSLNLTHSSMSVFILHTTTDDNFFMGKCHSLLKEILLMILLLNLIFLGVKYEGIHLL